MTERGFHPFAVLHFLRKTILLYLLPLLQVLFARNWAALRTALVQGAALLTVLAAVSAAVLHAGRWRVDAQGTLRVRWRLGVRLDRCLKASQLAALTIERPLLYRLAGASRVVLYPAGQKRTLTLLLSAQNAQFLADRMMPRRDAVAHTRAAAKSWPLRCWVPTAFPPFALLALAIKQSRPYAPDAQTAAFAHLNRICGVGSALAAHGHSMAAGAGRCAVLRKPCAQCGPCGPLHRVAHRESPWQQGRLCAPV